VSGVLSSLYYGTLEEEFTKFLKDETNESQLHVLMRLTDDYLFITDDIVIRVIIIRIKL
jgi:hypothetical protein